ncbi:SPFH domain / Band 7 family [Seminavis robusta]|uniref:SPFH domain / Band 7 family n=1 Tax=Seminavis robusta TaxID=568900 RepID=A0A9N8DJM0_9STRA|nr:SPFH domain / Band 7 family [Seminavis robusta]|eukprot:Sro95_g049240.1 SPFH domain / Band 7 family (338) ;mRNA; r:40541-41791
MKGSHNRDEESGEDNGCCSNFTCASLFDKTWKQIAWGIFGIAVLATAIALLATSLKKVDSTEYGLEYNVHNKQLDDLTKEGGLHTGPPGFEFIKFPSTFVTVDLPDGTCVSRDGLRVRFAVTFQYQMPKDWMRPAVIKYRNFDRWATVVEAAGTSAVQHTCSLFETASYQQQRGLIQNAMEENLRIKLEGPDFDGVGGVYARAISLQLKEVTLPDAYKDAVAAKQEAAEDIELAKNQRTQETTKARTALLSAQEEARKIIDSAENNANVTLTEATLQAEEIAFALQTEAQVLVRAKTSLNLTTDGLLAYMTNKLYESIPNLRVSTGEPAKLSRKEEL